MSDSNDVPAAMSTSALQAKLKELKENSNKHSQILTAKLASSQSGQNLLHIGTSLSTLPPDLHSLLTQLHPVLSAAESTEKQFLQRLEKLVDCGNEIRTQKRRVEHAYECADLYLDLLACEQIVKRDANYRRSDLGLSSSMEAGDALATALGKRPVRGLTHPSSQICLTVLFGTQTKSIMHPPWNAVRTLPCVLSRIYRLALTR